VRNQFFTPRYVVEFLTDNTVGRAWYEMRQGDTRLVEKCRYLVRRPNEVFLEEGEDPLFTDDGQPIRQAQDKPTNDEEQATNDRAPISIPFRAKKDPRDLKILDPACGSGHFLLYVFDLLSTIYEEAWDDPTVPAFSVTGTRLAADYATLAELRQAAPELILRHNLHGIDIDPRAVQIAALALWLRAQRAYQELELPPVKRPRITKTNLVTAEPMPGDRTLLEEFLRNLRPRVLADLVQVVFDKMKLAGEAGALLKIEEELAEAISQAREQAAAIGELKQGSLPGFEQPQNEQITFDLSDLPDDDHFWQTAEHQVLSHLRRYAEQVDNGQGARRRLFAEDAVHGFAFIDLCRENYDIVLMNPPFGKASRQSKPQIEKNYPRSKGDLLANFIERTLGLCLPQGLVGAISSRTCFFLGTLDSLRSEVLQKDGQLLYMADLGDGVLEAVVETTAYILTRQNDQKVASTFFRVLLPEDKEISLLQSVEKLNLQEFIPYQF
jgi:hypothetical protein